MATVVIIGVIIAVCILAVKSYMRKLAHGCCGAAGDSEQPQAHNGDLSGYNYRYIVTIGGMSCKNCAAKIENSFNRQKGTFAQADYKAGVTEIYSEIPVTEISLRQRIIGLGYSVERIEENELRM
ncbi:MAG: hypothetical protein ACI4J1_01345 [Ruminiclostridium sp.]